MMFEAPPVPQACCLKVSFFQPERPQLLPVDQLQPNLVPLDLFGFILFDQDNPPDGGSVGLIRLKQNFKENILVLI